MVSVVISAHNEADEVRRTVHSIFQSVKSRTCEVIVVDDGSADGCCEIGGDALRILRHEKRIGVGYSRDEACQIATGEVFAFLDGHQRVEDDSLSRCADLAALKSCIVCPDVAGFYDEERLHGAYFSLCRQNGFFGAEWKKLAPVAKIRRVTSLKAPAYFISRSIYSVVKWSPKLRGWGGSEACVSLKAFFAGVEILHFCGPLIRHQFKTQFHYDVSWAEVWRNHAIIARICFTDRTWYEYWLPEVFESHLSEEVRLELESAEIKAEQLEFAKFKVRPDEHFWSRLLFRGVPAALQ